MITFGELEGTGEKKVVVYFKVAAVPAFTWKY
jgi:hypothetical protein